MATYYIYTLSCDETKQPFYVGVTENVQWRFTGHKGWKYSATYKRIKTLKAGATIEVLEEVSVVKGLGKKVPLQVRQLEEYWIQQLKQWGFDLVNKRINTVAKKYPVSKYQYLKSLKTAA